MRSKNAATSGCSVDLAFAHVQKFRAAGDEQQHSNAMLEAPAVHRFSQLY